MTVYVPEQIDLEELRTLFTDNWDLRSGGEIPVPTFAVSDRARFDPSDQWGSTEVFAYVNIYAEDFREQVEGYAYEYVSQVLPVVIEIWTRRQAEADSNDRQHLHDVKQELRRILYSNKHSLCNWQLIRYQSFREQYEDSGVVRYHGEIRIELTNNGIKTPTELVAEDIFNRADGAIGAEWTQDLGTWEVVSNQAALQSATANAIARFTPSGITFKKNHLVQADLVTADAMDAGLVFRHVDSSNFWVAKLIEVGGVKFLRLLKTVATVETQVGEIREPGWVDGDRVELSVDLCNDGISVRYNCCPMIQLTDGTNSTGVSYGLFSNADQLTRFDNFHIFETSGGGR